MAASDEKTEIKKAKNRIAASTHRPRWWTMIRLGCIWSYVFIFVLPNLGFILVPAKVTCENQLSVDIANFMPKNHSTSQN